MWRQKVLLILLFCGFGCGGQVEVEPEGSGGSADVTTSGGSTSETAETSETADKKRLGSCKAGTKRSRTTECLWIADELCYPTWDAACNCICPTDVAEVFCVSDYPSEGIPTEVYCS